MKIFRTSCGASGRSLHAIAPTFDGTIIEWLVEDGDTVNAGQPLVRLQPEGTE